MNFLGLGGTPSVKIIVEGLSKKKHLTMKHDLDNNPVKLPIFCHNDSIGGTIEIKMNKCRKYEHQGIRLELVG